METAVDGRDAEEYIKNRPRVKTHETRARNSGYVRLLERNAERQTSASECGDLS